MGTGCTTMGFGATTWSYWTNHQSCCFCPPWCMCALMKNDTRRCPVFSAWISFHPWWKPLVYSVRLSLQMSYMGYECCWLEWKPADKTLLGNKTEDWKSIITKSLDSPPFLVSLLVNVVAVILLVYLPRQLTQGYFYYKHSLLTTANFVIIVRMISCRVLLFFLL